MKQRTTPKRRLLALNLALVLLCSLILPVSAGAASNNIVIGKGSGTVDRSGPGWVYDASERTLTLDNYQRQPDHLCQRQCGHRYREYLSQCHSALV